MEIFCVEIAGLDEKKARCPARSRRKGSAFGMSLLAYAIRQVWGMTEMPEIEEDDKGRPFFPEYPDRHFSISHGRTHAVCAVAEQPVGIDIETQRPMRSEVEARLMAPEEQAMFNFFEIWVLRESVYKLTHQGDLRTMRFRREDGRIIPPVAGVTCRLYREIGNCALAVSDFDGEFPKTIQIVPPDAICS
jgi:phosphopantetheinyl transferase